ncbi:MAG: GntR family transcriptional regulator, partial [Rhodoferax sp.]|nr:GntR family transcriptional regulator [Rhodoferax sp.]
LGIGDVPVVVTAPPTTLAAGREGLLRMRAAHPRTDVVFCSSDALAHGVITEAQAGGMVVPRDIAVMGFGNLGFAAHTHPALSTVHIDGTAIGRQAARFILDRVDGVDTGPRIRDIGFSLINRASL